MSVESGSATDVFDLLEKIGLFADNVLGWTVNKQTSNELYLQHGSDYFNLRADNSLTGISTGINLGIASGPGSWVNPGIAVMASRGFNDGSAWNNQPGNSGRVSPFGIFHLTNVPQYIFMSNASADYLHIVARRDAAVWTTLMIGRLEKFAAWTGGAYTAAQPWHNGTGNQNNAIHIFRGNTGTSTTGSNRGTVVHADIDSLTDAWQMTGNTVSGARQLRCLDWIANNNFFEIGPAEWSGRTPMMPMMALLARGDGTWSYAGQAPDARHLVDEFMPNGNEFVLGSDTWLHVNEVAFRLIN